MENVTQQNEKSITGDIKVNEKEVMEYLDRLVRKSVEDTLNTLLNEETDAICKTGRYQQSSARQQCPNFCTLLFLTDYCNLIKLYYFIKFASV